MKKSLLILTVLLLAVVFTAGAESLTLSGNVAANASLTITNDSTNSPSSLLIGDGISKTDLLIASINEKANKKDGYIVTVYSTNGALSGELAGNTDSLAYSIKYGDTNPVTVASGDMIGLSNAAEITNVAEKTGGSGVDKNLYITYNAAFLAADDYSDTLTFTIANK